MKNILLRKEKHTRMAHNGEQWKVIGDQESEGLYHLREAQAAYNSDFTPEKDGLKPKTPIFWTLIYIFQQVRVARPPIANIKHLEVYKLPFSGFSTVSLWKHTYHVQKFRVISFFQ